MNTFIGVIYNKSNCSGIIIKDMERDKLKELVRYANEERLREIVNEWIDVNPEFRDFVEYNLNPPINEIDFDKVLAQAIMHEANQCVRRGSEILDWSNIYYYQIEPLAKKAESLTTYSLRNFIVAIITHITMAIDDEDFSGDDWYGNDYSQFISDILETLGNLFGLLIIRDRLTDSDLDQLQVLVTEAQKEDKIHSYLNTPYQVMLDLIRIRREAEEVSCGLFEVMIDANFNQTAGEWICRKVDFIRSLGLDKEALSVIKENIRYPEVCLKYYNELIAGQLWDEALTLLDNAHKLKKENNDRWFSYSVNPDWLSMKQNLLMEHGSKEAQITNLCQLFHESYDDKKRECYNKLKEMVAEEDWKKFYTDLLSSESGYFALDSVAPFLIIEKEFDWLYDMLRENEQRDKTDYRHPLKYASYLITSHDTEIRLMLVRTFREYASDRFGYKRKVKTGKYHYFCNDLKSLEEIGAKEELKELVTYFKAVYSTRPSFMAELRRIKI